MEEKKDFLGSIASSIEKKPESFQEEKVERYIKPKPKMNPVMIGGAVVAVIAVGVLVYFLFFAANIKMPNFVGKTTNDLGLWVKQEGIENQSIILVKEYNLEYDADVIISQTAKEGSKIKKDTKLTFVVSQGANPDDKIAFPDLKTMQYDDIQEWVKTNKLLKTKVNQVYDEKVAEGTVLSYDLKNVNEADFTRGTSLTINVSRGPQPAQEVVVKDFAKQLYSVVEEWAKTNKITLEKVEQYHDTIENGMVISTSVKADSKIKQGETLKVYVSKGKAVTMIDMSGMSKDRAIDWCTTNGVKCYTREVYSNDNAGKLLSQSVAKGKVLDKNASVDLKFSLGRPNLDTFKGTTFDELVAWVDECNRVGDAQMPKPVATYETNDAAYGTILSSLKGTVDTGSTIRVNVSEGKKIYIDQSALGTAKAGDEAAARAFCTKLGLNCEVKYVAQTGGTIGNVANITLADATTPLTGGIYIKAIDKIIVQIIEKNS